MDTTASGRPALASSCGSPIDARGEIRGHARVGDRKDLTHVQDFVLTQVQDLVSTQVQHFVFVLRCSIYAAQRALGPEQRARGTLPIRALRATQGRTGNACSPRKSTNSEGAACRLLPQNAN